MPASAPNKTTTDGGARQTVKRINATSATSCRIRGCASGARTSLHICGLLRRSGHSSPHGTIVPDSIIFGAVHSESDWKRRLSGSSPSWPPVNADVDDEHPDSAHAYARLAREYGHGNEVPARSNSNRADADDGHHEHGRARASRPHGGANAHGFR
jgi:hypothetical protein